MDSNGDSRMINICDAIHILSPESRVIVRSESLDMITWTTGNPKGITKGQIQAKLAELQALEPIRLLRIDRDKLLAETDWVGLSDTALTNEKSAEWKLYRQKLRDLPSGLDTVDKVNAVTWPEKPE
jgi:hypothetical protein